MNKIKGNSQIVNTKLHYKDILLTNCISFYLR